MQESYVLEDEENKAKLQECVDLLLAAGYFKVRIRSLDVFDKIVGGMVWCLSSTDAKIDASILFMENMNIREKIYVTQQIVKALQDMKCPYKLQPHQIQGYDLFNIYPVLQWLVKQSHAAQQNSAQLTKKAVEYHFSKYFEPSHPAQKTSLQLDLSSIKTLIEPVRLFCKKPSYKPLSISDSVASTLLEYKLWTESPSTERPLSKPGNENERDMSLKANFTKVGSTLSIAKVKKLVDANQAREENEQTLTEVKSGLKSSKHKIIKRLPLTPLQELTQMETVLERLVTQYKLKQKTLNEKQDHSASLQTNLEELAANIGKAEDGVGALKIKMAFDSPNVQSVYNDLLEYSAMKEEQTRNRSTYKEQLGQLQLQLETMTKEFSNPAAKNELSTKLTAIREEYTKMERKLTLAEAAITKRNSRKTELILERQDKLSALELSFFQKRFTELHEEMLLVHFESENYFELENSLSELVQLLKKELSIIESINQNFETASKKPFTQLEFSKGIDRVISTASDSLQKMNDSLSKISLVFRNSNAKYQELVAKTHLYSKFVAEFQKKIKTLA